MVPAAGKPYEKSVRNHLLRLRGAPLIAEETERWGKVIRAAKIKPD
jgi:hypothetical protein